MPAQTFGTWDQNALGAGLVLQMGGLVIVTGDSNLTNARKALGTLPKGSGTGYFENEFYSVPQVNLGTNCAVGVAQPTSALNAAPGQDALSWAFYPGTGDVKNNGAVLMNIGIVPERTVISVYLSLITTPQLILAVSGSWKASIALPAGKVWLPTAMLAGGNAGETGLYTNMGQRGFNYTRIEGPPV
jgi:hypothetical protein